MRAQYIFYASASACLAALAFACGNGGATVQTAQPSLDAGAADAATEAASTTNDVYPADHPPLPEIANHGGRVLKAPKLVTVTFQGMDTTVRDYLRDFDDKILATPWWTAVMEGYGVGPGVGVGYAELEDVFSGKTTDNVDVQAWIADQVVQGKLPMPDDQTVYMIYMPSAAQITLEGTSSCTGFGGYHDSGDLSAAHAPSADAGAPEGGAEAGADAGPPKPFLYAVLMECYSGFPNVTAADIKDEETDVASHEIAEAATDPDVNVPGVPPGYYMTNNDAWAPNQRGGEVGDLCENQPGYREGVWAVTKSWSAASAKRSHSPCVPEDSPIFFGAVPHTEIPARTVGASPSSDGYVVVKKGESRDVDVDVFSTAPLDAPLNVVAGRNKFGGSSDPTQMNPITKGVTSTLSAATAKNGDKLKLSITVDASAASGSYRFTVRALRSATDYHSWPAILYVP